MSTSVEAPVSVSNGPAITPTETSVTSSNGAKTYDQWILELDADSENVQCDKDDLLQRTKEFYNLFNGETNPEILWRLACNGYRAASIAESKGEKEKQKTLLTEAEENVKKALALNQENPEYHAWAAFIAGKLADFAGRKERIGRGHETQHHLEEAIRLKTKDAGVYYTYGRWCMEVAKLSWVERNLAAALFSKPPEATYQDALNKFTEADKMRPDWRANYLWMAKCYMNLKNNAKVIECLDIGVKCTPRDEEDLIVESELLSLQKKYSSYR